MKPSAPALAIALALGLSAPAFAGDHSHRHDSHDGYTLRLDQGRKWQTDAPLRQGMEGVRKDVAAKLEAIHKERMSATDYVTLADQIRGHVEFIVANCKLPPEADAQLHIVVAELIRGADEMKDGHDPDDGAERVVDALKVYPRYFDHPGWQGLGH